MALFSAGAAVATPLFRPQEILAAYKATTAPILVVGKGKDYATVVANVIMKIDGMAHPPNPLPSRRSSNSPAC